MSNQEKRAARGSAQRRRRLWRRRRIFLPPKDQKLDVLTKNETTFLRALATAKAQNRAEAIALRRRLSRRPPASVVTGCCRVRLLASSWSQTMQTCQSLELCCCRIISTTEAAHVYALSCQHHRWLSVRAYGYICIASVHSYLL